MTQKKCSKCGEVKPTSQFYPRRRKPGSFQAWCKICHKTTAIEWAKKNPERVVQIRIKRRDKQIKHMRFYRYGLSHEKYLALVHEQGDRCAVCKTHAKLYVDHCHSSGTVRGLLCNLCNVGIGSLRDKPQLLREAAAYLERTSHAANSKNTEAL